MIQAHPTSGHDPSRLARAGRWSARNFVSIFWAFDFWVGAAGGVGAGLLEELDRSAVDSQLTIVLLAELGAGIALLAVVLAALAIIVSLIDDNYLRVLELSDPDDGVNGALMPFVWTAGTSALTVIAGGFGAILALTVPVEWRAVILGFATFFAGWSVGGTFLLALQVVRHGVLSATLLKNINTAKNKVRSQRQA